MSRTALKGSPNGFGASCYPIMSALSLGAALPEAGEVVAEVPAQLAVRVRLFDTGQNRKTDAHSIAAAEVRTKTLRVLMVDGELPALRLLVGHCDALGRADGESPAAQPRRVSEFCCSRREQEGGRNGQGA